MEDKKLNVAEDRRVNGWNPPKRGKMLYILASLGPTALAVGLSMGPGSIGSALQLGALTGYRMLWVMIIIALAMAVESYITNFLIYASHKEGEKASTLIQLFRKHLGKAASIVIAVPAAIAFCFVILSQGTLVGSIVNNLFPAIPAWVAMVVSGPLMAFIFTREFDTIKKMFRILVGALTILFLINGIISGPDFLGILKGIIPSAPRSAAEGLAFAGVVGGSCGGVTFILQSYGIRNSGLTEKRHLKLMKWDVFATCVMFFIWNMGIYISAAAVLNPAGVEVSSAMQAAMALEPLAGSFAKYFMLIGILASVLTSAGGVCTLNTCIITDVMGKEPNPRENPFMKKITMALCLLMSFSVLYKNISSLKFVVTVMAGMTLAGPLVCIGILFIMFKKQATHVAVPVWQKAVTLLILQL